MSILKVEGLVKSFGGRKVVNGVSFEVEEGELVGLLGPNGAGKTTSFRMTCGLLAPDSGKVYLNDEDVTHWPMYRRARDGRMGYLPQQSSVFTKLTSQQNLLAMMELLKFPWRERKERCAELLEEFEITKVRKSKAGALSGGERRRLEIARCLVSDPKIIMLDEPFAGIDPVTVQSIQQIIQRLCDEGIAILITDHAAREILQITERTYVVSEGKILCSGTAEEVVEHPGVKEKYLGEIDGIEFRGQTRRTTVRVPIDSADSDESDFRSGYPQKVDMDFSDPYDSATFDEEDEGDQDALKAEDETEKTQSSRKKIYKRPKRKIVATRQTLLRKTDLD